MTRKDASLRKIDAFIEHFSLKPTSSGPLDGLRFVVKDIIDVAGYKTGCGNPTWLETHPVASVHAFCVEQLLAAGAECVGKSVTDELAFSLIGENHFYGTPLNPRAPDRVPGGSSSGSASAVASGDVDFALGTDTGGSVRIPANNCGIFGFRPTHGVISVAGVMPFEPSFDTVGVFASTHENLSRVACALLGEDPIQAKPIDTIYLLEDAFALTEENVKDALADACKNLSALGKTVKKISLADINQTSLSDWYTVYNDLQSIEIQNSLKTWLDTAKPELGPITKASFRLVNDDEVDRSKAFAVQQNRERLYRELNTWLGPQDLICMPTAPILAPKKGETGRNAFTKDYYHRTISLTSISVIARLPQLTLPVAQAGEVPVGLSLLASARRDAFLLQSAANLTRTGATRCARKV